MRLARLLALLFLALLAGCASVGGTQGDKLDRAQYAWSAAVRWNDFEGAVNLIDPARRAELTPTARQMERYRQVQISGYRDQGGTVAPYAPLLNADSPLAAAGSTGATGS